MAFYTESNVGWHIMIHFLFFFSKKIKNWIVCPSAFARSLLKYIHFIPDKIYLKMLYRVMVKQKLDIRNPQTFNEKIQWLKLYDRKPEYTQMVDKFAVREYIANRIGEEYLIPLLGTWDSFNAIDFDELPNQFVLKCTHNSGGVIICKNKDNLNINDVHKKMKLWLKKNYYYTGREFSYKYIKPRIIAEQYMVDESGTDLKDYKIQCFNGEPKIIQVDFDRFTNEHKRNFYSPEWEYQPFSLLYPTHPEIQIKKPESLILMLFLAEKLSQNIPYLRVDLYSIRQRIYFGELTFYHGSGYEKFDPPEWNRVFGDWLVLGGGGGGPPPAPSTLANHQKLYTLQADQTSHNHFHDKMLTHQNIFFA
jgi:hypothetical protein